MKDINKDLQEALDSGRWRLLSDEEELENRKSFDRSPLTEVGQFVSDVLDEEDPQYFIEIGAKPGHYRSFVRDIMSELDSVKNEQEVLDLLVSSFTKGFLSCVVMQGGKSYLVVEHTDEDYEMADRLVGGSEPYLSAAKKIWNHVAQTKED